MTTPSARSNYLSAYWLRSNIPGLEEQAMLSQVYDVQIPGLEGRLEEIVNGAIAGRMDWRGFQTARIHDSEFKSRTFFPALFGYIGVPTIGNVEDGDPVTFEFTMAYNRGRPTPNADLDDLAVKLVIDDCYIKGIPQGLIAAADGGEYTVQLYCDSWFVEYRAGRCSGGTAPPSPPTPTCPDASGLPGTTRVTTGPTCAGPWGCRNEIPEMDHPAAQGRGAALPGRRGFPGEQAGRWRWYLLRSPGQPSLCQSSTSFPTKLAAVANYLECAHLMAREWKDSKRPPSDLTHGKTDTVSVLPPVGGRARAEKVLCPRRAVIGLLGPGIVDL